jgi:hypothetical protein
VLCQFIPHKEERKEWVVLPIAERKDAKKRHTLELHEQVKIFSKLTSSRKTLKDQLRLRNEPISGNKDALPEGFVQTTIR